VEDFLPADMKTAPTSSTAILDGAARMGTLDLRDMSHVMSDLTLRAGDRAEVSKTGDGVVVRLENAVGEGRGARRELLGERRGRVSAETY
jgi:hypothetical protein